ncbi:molybdenum cofactor biosynthesis protein A [Clostridium sp. C105KSO15]|nr:molybdenum cofactor biosynthesis protein A [Clostridium sp. C105KSO15]
MERKYNFDIAPQFVEYFKELHQVFLYLIDDCQLHCTQCLYKLDNNFYLSRKEIAPEQALGLIEDFYALGARKLTLMGGEPTLYCLKQKRQPLFDLIEKAKSLGYEYVRMDTNGQFESSLLEHSSMRKLDEVTFSLDGPTAEINDSVRGVKSFDCVVRNIKKAVSLNYNVNITCCIHDKLVERNKEGELYISEMVHFASGLGVECLNFHDLFKGGIPRDHWTGNIDISIDKWFEVWTELQTNIEKGCYPIPLRIPQSFVTAEEFANDSEYYGYCSVKTGDRILVHPNGIMRVCSLMIGTPYGIARYHDDKIEWDNGYTNELLAHDMNNNTPCTNQMKNNRAKQMKPTCVSFKPKQNEFVWKLKLAWEGKKDNE